MSINILTNIAFLIIASFTSLVFEPAYAYVKNNINDTALSCIKIEVEEGEILSSKEIQKISSYIIGISVARLFYKDRDGYCIPTNDTYLIGFLQNDYPIILTTINGHSVRAEIKKLGGREVLAIFYHTGGNQTILKLFDIKDELILPIGKSVASNIDSIVIKNNLIFVANSSTSIDGKRKVLYSRYTLEGNILKNIPLKSE